MIKCCPYCGKEYLGGNFCAFCAQDLRPFLKAGEALNQSQTGIAGSPSMDDLAEIAKKQADEIRTEENEKRLAEEERAKQFGAFEYFENYNRPGTFLIQSIRDKNSAA